jgi:hypothetical protein
MGQTVRRGSEAGTWQQRPWHTQLAVAFGLFDGLRGVRGSKTRMFLALRPPKLSRSSTEHMTEMTRQMTLVEKTHGERNFR